MKQLLAFVFLLSSIYGFSEALHPVSITWITADLQDERVLLTIKVSAEDLLYFHELTPDSLFDISSDNLLKAAEEHGQVLQEAFSLLNQDGNRIASRFTHSDLSAIGNTSINVMDLTKTTLSYKFEFDLEAGIEFLTFEQNLVGVPAISFLMLTKNGNVLINQRELRSDKPFTIKRDALSFGKEEDQHFMISYFTVSDTRVTHEITLPLKLLKSFIQLENFEDLEAVKNFIEENSAIEVDEKIISPIVETFTLLNGENAPLDQSLVNMQIVYPLQNIPNLVLLRWELYNWRMRWFESIIDAFGLQKKHNFSRFQTEKEIVRDSLILEKN
ncbi:MAG: hypothetical protein ACI8WP_001151 [Flavobacteriaceae bacterium]|jgi:hypothetical protein